MSWFPGMTGIDLSDFATTFSPDSEVTRYCLACDCSQKAVASTRCWQCGGATQGSKPGYWPNSVSGESVKDGKSFSVSEVLTPEGEYIPEIEKEVA